MQQTVMSGLDGRNPMAFFASLGALLATSRVRPDASPRLSWTNEPIPRPTLHANLDAEDLIDALDGDRGLWSASVALEFDGLDDVKLPAGAQREYLRACRSADDGGRSPLLGAALIAEGAFAGTGDGKPTDLHFNAGQQRFLMIARSLRDQVTAEDLREAVFGPWTYSRTAPTFGWDVSDDRIYALSAADPSKDTKHTMPGADWLGLVGLGAFPVVRSDGKSTPPGASGTWKRGEFRWGLWDQPLDWSSAAALIAMGLSDTAKEARVGLFRVMRSAIRRSDQGGYGSFSPSTIEWGRTRDQHQH